MKVTFVKFSLWGLLLVGKTYAIFYIWNKGLAEPLHMMEITAPTAMFLLLLSEILVGDQAMMMSDQEVDDAVDPPRRENHDRCTFFRLTASLLIVGGVLAIAYLITVLQGGG